MEYTSLPNGKIQTINSIKYHPNKIKELLDISFKYHNQLIKGEGL